MSTAVDSTDPQKAWAGQLYCPAQLQNVPLPCHDTWKQGRRTPGSIVPLLYPLKSLKSILKVQQLQAFGRPSLFSWFFCSLGGIRSCRQFLSSALLIAVAGRFKVREDCARGRETFQSLHRFFKRVICLLVRDSRIKGQALAHHQLCNTNHSFLLFLARGRIRTGTGFPPGDFLTRYGFRRGTRRAPLWGLDFPSAISPWGDVGRNRQVSTLSP